MRASGTASGRTRDAISADLWLNAQSRGLIRTLRAAVFNPGFSAVLRYRLARKCMLSHNGAVRFAGRFIWLSNVRVFGCHIFAEAEIGPGLRLPHPVGIVIGEGVIIGRNVTIYQNVTFGRQSAADASYPVIGDNVVIYAGAVIVGSISIGDDAVIGANSVVTRDVPAGAVAKGIPARVRD